MEQAADEDEDDLIVVKTEFFRAVSELRATMSRLEEGLRGDIAKTAMMELSIAMELKLHSIMAEAFDAASELASNALPYGYNVVPICNCTE